MPLSLHSARLARLWGLVLLSACASASRGPASAPSGAAVPAVAAGPGVIALAVDEAGQRVDVSVDGQPFTSYLWRPALKKPLLYPVRTAGGALITRGWPVEPRPDEATDHPHHLGLWLNYGDVDGVDFWNNNEKRDPGKYGVVAHKAVTRAEGGKGRGQLDVSCDWVMPDGRVALAESTSFVFAASGGRRVIDRTTTLRATGPAVSMSDHKEGMLGLRLGNALEMTSKRNPAGTGNYRSSEGVAGKDVWGTRGRWLALSGQVDGAPVTVAIFDHPSNPGHPTHWHARPYGLFAANPLGQKQLSKGERTLSFAIPAGGNARFAYRVLIASETLTPAALDEEYARFAAQAP